MTHKRVATSSKRSTAWYNNLYVYSFIIFTASLSVGTIFYKYANSWDWALSYYFAASVLLGDMYLVPTERSEISQIFTLMYFLWGTILMAGAIASAANAMIDHAMRVAAEERKRILSQDEVEDYDGDGQITWYDHCLYHSQRLLHRIGWYSHRSKYLSVLLLCVWFSIGICYGTQYEAWSLGTSIFFTISAMSAAGSAPPICEGEDATNCTLGTTRSLLLGTYLIIGVPIFAYFMGQFAELLVEHAIRAKEIKLMMRPLSEEEFQFACELQHGNILNESTDDMDPLLTSQYRPHTLHRQKTMYQRELRLDFGDFIVLELLRLKKITKTDLEYIKELFDMLDEDGDGLIIKPAHLSTPRVNPDSDGVGVGKTSMYGSLSTIPEDEHEDAGSVLTKSIGEEGEGTGGEDSTNFYSSQDSSKSNNIETLRQMFARTRSRSRSGSVKFGSGILHLPKDSTSDKSLGDSDYSEVGVELSPSPNPETSSQAEGESSRKYRSSSSIDEGISPQSVSPLYDETPTSFYSPKEDASPLDSGEASENSSARTTDGGISSAYNALIIPTLKKIRSKAKAVSRLRSSTHFASGSKLSEYTLGWRRKTDIDIESLRNELLNERTALLESKGMERTSASSKYTKSEP